MQAAQPPTLILLEVPCSSVASRDASSSSADAQPTPARHTHSGTAIVTRQVTLLLSLHTKAPLAGSAPTYSATPTYSAWCKLCDLARYSPRPHPCQPLCETVRFKTHPAGGVLQQCGQPRGQLLLRWFAVNPSTPVHPLSATLTCTDSA